MRRRAALLALLAQVAAPLVRAQADWQRVAVPYLTPQAWLDSLDATWYAPRAAEFALAAERLAARLNNSACDVTQARAAWQGAMLAWERLSAVQTSALIERRSALALDFQPTRPAAIERAMAQPGIDLAQVGAPALGLPALEWLLWRAALREGTPACAYAGRVAAQLSAEAHALAAAFATPRERDEEAAQRDFATLLNQLVGGVASLRWAQIGKPRRQGRNAWPRATSGLTPQAWRARAGALRQLLEHHGSVDAPVALEPFLRGRGMNPLADRVRQRSADAAAALRVASPQRAASLQRAERALNTLERLLSDEVAPALQVTIGFSDADGD